MNTFEQSILVEENHLDELQHVNNVQYLQWVQDIAGAHWQELIKDNPTEFGLWVVRSHHIEYKRQAKLGDRLKIVTHVALTKGFQSERRVRFFLADSD
ncbi:MAG: acyl-CoA thioesterase, partial [Flavobacteriaceae bacterium]